MKGLFLLHNILEIKKTEADNRLFFKDDNPRRETMRRICILFLAILFVLPLLIPAVSTDGAQKRLTVEWLFDTRIQEKFRTPSYTWLNSGKVLLLDYRRERQERNLEFFDPESGERFEAIKRDRLLVDLKRMAGKNAPSTIRWPDAVDANGQAFIYVLGGDLYLVELGQTSVKRLTRTPSPEKSVTFSPDGRWVSFIRDNDIYAIDWRNDSLSRLTFGATDTLLNGPLSWVYWEEIYDRKSLPYCWSPDSRCIAYLQTDDSPVSVSTFVHFRPATQRVVRQRYPKAGQTNPRVRLGVVDISSGKTTWMDADQYEYLARFNWLPDSSALAVQTLDRRQSELKLLIADRKSGRSHKVLTETQPAWINLNDALYFLRDGKRFIWMSERDGYQHLYLYWRDGHLVRQLTEGDFMVLSAEGALVMGNRGLVAVDEKEGWVYFASNRRALKERHLYRIRLDGTGLERLTQKEGVHAVRFSPSNEYFLDVYSSCSNPPSLTLCRADGQKIQVVSPSAKNLIEDFKISYPEFRTFPADNGLELPAMITWPMDFSPERKYPVIIYVYGGPGAQQVVERWRSRWLWHSLLAQEGFIVCVFEVRAGMGKNKALETSVYKRAYGMQNVKDILAGVRWLKTMPFIDSERIGIWGASGGGCTTLYTMTHSDVFKAGIAVAPVSDWHFYDTIYTERYQSTPHDNPEGYRETSSVLAASNLKGRLLIIHGTYDDNVHPQNTYAFIDELIKHNIPFELMIYPWRKHGISDHAARIHRYTLMLDFWRRNLK